MERLADLPTLPSDGAPPWLLLPHCTERTNAPRATTQWQAVCDRFGVDLRILPSGCCGMAGLYGHQAANRTTSKNIYGLSWAEHVANPPNFGRLLATGYSCRSQVKLIDGVALRLVVVAPAPPFVCYAPTQLLHANADLWFAGK